MTTINATGNIQAYGIQNDTQMKSLSGEVRFAGNTDITVKANQVAVGVANTTIYGPANPQESGAGVFLLGSSNVINATSTGTSTGGIYGTYAAAVDVSNETANNAAPTSQTVINNLTGTATGENGASSYGLRSRDGGIVSITGTSRLTAKTQQPSRFPTLH